MKRLPISPLALLLALALASPAQAEEFRTSQGLHSLRPLATATSESGVRQAIVEGERLLQDQLTDITALERARTGVNTDLGALPAQVKAEQAKVDAEKAKFDQMDKDYRAHLDAFTQKQLALDAETQRQVNEAATLQALPSAQRNFADVERLNKWADDIAARRKAFGGERDTLMAEHDTVEAERLNVERMRQAAEAKLKQSRDASVGQYGAADAKLDAAYQQLQSGITYTEAARNLLRSKFGKDPGASSVLERANSALNVHKLQRR
jgi:hypothetical protein